jgi:hypothetical protein
MGRCQRRKSVLRGCARCSRVVDHTVENQKARKHLCSHGERCTYRSALTTPDRMGPAVRGVECVACFDDFIAHSHTQAMRPEESRVRWADRQLAMVFSCEHQARRVSARAGRGLQ